VTPRKQSCRQQLTAVRRSFTLEICSNFEHPSETESAMPSVHESPSKFNVDREQKREQHEVSIGQVHACPECGSPTIYTPTIRCSHCDKQLPIRCYVYRRGNAFYGECLTLNLVSRGSTLDEAILRLQRAMFAYVETVFAEGKSAKGLIPRSAPLSSWVRYYLHTWKRRLIRFLGRTNPLDTTSVPSPEPTRYTVVEC